jgi:hypothetical protein
VVEEAFDLEGALEDELLDVDVVVVVVVVVVGVLTTTGTAGVSGKLQAPLEKT